MEKKLVPTLIAAASAAEAVDAAAHILDRDAQPDMPDTEIVQPAPEKSPLDYVPIHHQLADDTWALQLIEEAQVERFDGEKPPTI